MSLSSLLLCRSTSSQALASETSASSLALWTSGLTTKDTPNSKHKMHDIDHFVQDPVSKCIIYARTDKNNAIYGFPGFKTELFRLKNGQQITIDLPGTVAEMAFPETFNGFLAVTGEHPAAGNAFLYDVGRDRVVLSMHLGHDETLWYVEMTTCWRYFLGN